MKIKQTNICVVFKKHKLIMLSFLIVFIFLGLFSGVFFSLGGIREKTEASVYPREFSFRDDYFVNLTDQGQFGTCWAFANIKSIENFLAINTGEHFEISESYVALTNLTSQIDFLLGNGGSVRDVATAFNRYGFLLDSDLPYQDIYFLNSSNSTQMLNILKKEADTTTIKISSDIKSASYIENTEVIKYYITEYGNASINIENWDMKKVNGLDELIVGSNGGHALSVMGWDDNYLASNGTRGAYLILNSYGEYSSDGIVYLPYSTAVRSNVYAFAYKVSLPDDYVYLTSNAEYKVTTKGKYYSSTNYTGQETTLKEQNIFDVDDDFLLEYNFGNLNELNYSIDIYKGDVDVSDQFRIIKDDSKCYIRRRGNLESGSYKLKLNYSYNKNGGKIQRNILKQLFLLDGLELAGIDKVNEENGIRDNVMIDSLSMIDNNIYITQYGTNFVGATEIGVSLSSYAQNVRYTLSKVNSSFNVSGSFLSKGRIGLQINSSYIVDGENKFTLQLTNARHSKIINIYIYKDSKGRYLGEGYSNTMFSSYVRVDLEGGQLPSNYKKTILISTNLFARNYLEEPTKENYKFTGYEYLKSNGEWGNLPFDAAKQKYFITSAYVRNTSANNYYTKYYKCFNYRNSVIIKANYEEDLNPIIMSSQTKPNNNTFGIDEKIYLNLNKVGASNINWTLSGLQIGQGNTLELTGLKSNSYILIVNYTLNGKNYTYSRKLFVKYHLYIVNIVENLNSNPFIYNKTLQHPTITITDLVEGEDYTLQYPNSIEAGTYKVIIKPTIDNIELSMREIEYRIYPKQLTGEIHAKIIRQGEDIGTFSYQINGWLENEDLKVNFDTSKVDIYKVGEFNIPVKFANITSSYDISKVSYATLVVVEANFDSSMIDIITTDNNDNESSVFKYGQGIVFRHDRPQGMFEYIEYTLNGKTYSNKVQYLTERLPVGTYTLKSKAKIIDGETIQGEIIERETTIEIVKLNVKITVLDAEGIKGEDPKGLKYNVEADYPTTGLNIELEILEFDKNKLGEYEVTANLSGMLENYNVTVVNGTYKVVRSPQFLTNVILICVFVGLALIIAIAIFIRRKHKQNELKKKSDW